MTKEEKLLELNEKLLMQIEKLQKENEELKEKNNKYENAEIFSLKQVDVIKEGVRQGTNEFVNENFIPKYKIREKLNQEYEEYTNLMKAQQSVETKNIWTYQHNAIKGILEELLGEE